MASASHSSSPEPTGTVGNAAERRVRDVLTAELLSVASAGAGDGRAVSNGRPISFNAAMARALLAGQKTQTRRPIKPLPTGQTMRDGIAWPAGRDGEPVECRLAAPRELLWVREPSAAGPRGVEYEADVGPKRAAGRSWRGGRYMARSASRLTLRVTSVRPERLADLSGSDAAAEGMPPGLFSDDPDTAIVWFQRLWDGIYGRDPDLSWRANPWVWAIEFRLIAKNIDAIDT